MEKITIQDISRILVEKNGLKVRDAEKFAATMFAVIRETLENNQPVKVRGLGTFKIIEVDSRESVNVNTGERVLIAGHDKITFTPDATMKELVNKPFSQFETVVLNEGVVFDDVPEESPEPAEPIEPEESASLAEPTEQVKPTEPTESVVPPPPVPVMAAEIPPIPVVEKEKEIVPETETPVEEPVVEEPVVEEPVVEEPVVEEPVVEQPVVEEPVVEQPVVEQPVVEQAPIPERRTPLYEQDYNEERKGRGKRWLLSIFVVLLLMAASAAGGYYYGYQQGSRMIEMTEVAEPDSALLATVDTVAVDHVATAPTDTTATDAEPPSTAPQPKEPAAEQPAAAKTEKPAEAETDKYAEMDPRVKHGAYRIIGEDFTVKVRPGETTARIAKRTLGEGMECYIEVYNGIKSNAELKEGQTVIIPKLQWKKKKKVTQK